MRSGRGGDGGKKINKMLVSIKAGCWEKEGLSHYYLYFWVFESFDNKGRFFRNKLIINKNAKAPTSSPPTHTPHSWQRPPEGQKQS